MNRASMFMGGLVALAVLVGCGKDKVVLGLGHTYEQILARSSGFEIDREFPFRWGFEEAMVHLDLGDGTFFSFDSASGHGFANHPNPSHIKPGKSGWMAATVVDVSIFVDDLVSLKDARSPEMVVALMAAIRASGWVRRRPHPTAQEIKAMLAVPPHYEAWDFRRDDRSITVRMGWHPDGLTANSPGVTLTVYLSTNEPINVLTKPNVMSTKDHIMVTE